MKCYNKTLTILYYTIYDITKTLYKSNIKNIKILIILSIFRNTHTINK